MTAIFIIKEPIVDWFIVGQIGWLTLLGLIAFVLDKIVDAKKVPGFSWKIFWEQNLFGFILAFVLCLIGLLVIGPDIQLVAAKTKILIAIGLGWGGGAGMRSVLKKVNTPNQNVIEKESNES